MGNGGGEEGERKGGIPGRTPEARKSTIFRNLESGWECGAGDQGTEVAEGWPKGED